MLNLGDDANRSHSDRCHPLTGRKARATQLSFTGEGLQNDQNTGTALRDANTTRRAFS